MVLVNIVIGVQNELSDFFHMFGVDNFVHDNSKFIRSLGIVIIHHKVELAIGKCYGLAATGWHCLLLACFELTRCYMKENIPLYTENVIWDGLGG